MVSEPISHTSIINGNSFFKNILVIYLKLRRKGEREEMWRQIMKKSNIPFFSLMLSYGMID
jgi:hypothetical protein